MNFARDVVEAAPRAARALVARDVSGVRRELSFGEAGERSARLAGALAERGVGRGDVVTTVVGSTPEWVLTLVACFRIGAVALPCTEQLRAGDLRARLEAMPPRLVVASQRNVQTVTDAGFDGTLLRVPDESLFDAPPAPAVELEPEEPALVAFTSGTAGEPKPIRHGQRYLEGQRVQAEHWLGARPGELVWCTAATGWSKSARNVFIAPWLRGAAAMLEDRRFEPHRRIATAQREGVNVLCMTPTEYRAVATRAELRRLPALRHAVAAGEPLDPGVVHAWRAGTGVAIHDGYGQTETGALTGMPLGGPLRPGSMGKSLPGFEVWVEDGELCADPATVPTFFIDGRRDRPWRTGDRVRADVDGYLWFEGRTDDVILSSGYRIGPFEVESALSSHPAVAEAAAVAAPDELRGSVVRAVVVLRDGERPSDELVRALQDHVKDRTAPYKYPRIVDFADELPRTPSGKVRRALLRTAG